MHPSVVARQHTDDDMTNRTKCQRLQLKTLLLFEWCDRGDFIANMSWSPHVKHKNPVNDLFLTPLQGLIVLYLLECNTLEASISFIILSWDSWTCGQEMPETQHQTKLLYLQIPFQNCEFSHPPVLRHCVKKKKKKNPNMCGNQWLAGSS